MARRNSASNQEFSKCPKRFYDLSEGCCLLLIVKCISAAHYVTCTGMGGDLIDVGGGLVMKVNALRRGEDGDLTSYSPHYFC